MTRLPAENRDVTGVEYSPDFPKYKVGPICSAPGCSRLSDHAHHIWRRSFLAGDYGWVKLWDGTVVQNLAALCHRCHTEITENRAVIRWTGVRFVWDDELVMGMHLDPMPKVWHAGGENVEEAAPEPVTSYGDHDHDAPGAVEKCPTCKRAVKRRTDRTERARARKSWSITVPADERENGADVLDTLLEEAAKMVGHDGDNSKTRYHTLAFALGMFVMHCEELLSDA